ncbi:hypothetical protein I6N95_14275 [Vagococcus sp. BWB3-3]|uniref:Peptidase M14 domain-containing protein n=1 Tax=Vagococcus allomyrinae TaxID=2794353 RepID=A0A940P9M7_9ENTE|nr:M14 family metallopeptidase [Vagococcus allomyrinae]MBP1042181.1 hypothetical protein [Vagococcus allomyrinae]
MEKLVIRAGMSLAEQKQAIQVAFMQGFRAEMAIFPICDIENWTNVAFLYQENQLVNLSTTDEGNSVNQFAEKSLDFDWRSQQGLESLFERDYLLQDLNDDFLADQLALKVWLVEAVDVWQLSALCNIMYRFGMETTAYEGSLFATAEDAGNLLVVETNDRSGISVAENQGRKVIKLRGEGQSLVNFVAHFCQFFPDDQSGGSLLTVMQEMTKSFCLQNPDGQQVYTATKEESQTQDFLQYIAPVKIFEKEYSLIWEVTEFKVFLQEEIYPQLRPGDSIAIYGSLSEGIEQRQQLQAEIIQELLEMKVEVTKVEIVSAYKQGFSWISDYVIPELSQLERLDRIDIQFKPFLPEGQEEWLDEDGATPSYHTVSDDNPDRWLDLPIRFLQELYPIDDVLAEKLSLSTDSIQFSVNNQQETTYLLKGYAQEQEVYHKSYQAVWAERSYIDQFPELGKAHPATGQIRVEINQKEVIQQRIKTDLERIWDSYQQELLPTFGELVTAKTNGLGENCHEPLFSKIVLEATVSEPEYYLNSRQDMISSLNSFHEDLYFVGLDYFKKYGLKKWNRLLDAPGLLLPVLKVGTGAPSFKCTVYDQEDTQPFIWQAGRKRYSQYRKEEVKVFIEEINESCEPGLFDLVIRTEGIAEDYLDHYVRLVRTGDLEVVSHLKRFASLSFKTDEAVFSAEIPAKAATLPTLSIEEIDLMETEVIGYQAYSQIITQLKCVPELSVSQIGTTYQGREIYGIQIAGNTSAYVSRVKRLTNYPSLIINARHHANEVSGTNGALLLIKELLTNPKYASLSERLNLMIVPLENVDGAEIHHQLQQQNPCWKLHVARFNAVGKEFYNEYFNHDTIYPEALAFTKIWYQLLPDVVVDNHGVPSHEWDQQFSGYTSPSYKGFWLPRSLLYGYFWAVKDDKFKANLQLNQAIEKAIAQAIGANQEMTSLNKEWMNRFETYAHKWLPQLFPANYYQNMINYWLYFDYEVDHRYPSIRFPWITSVAYTSEVADETAQGAYLKLCGETHLTHDLATIDLLLKLEPNWSEEWQVGEESLRLKRIRQRPLLG